MSIARTRCLPASRLPVRRGFIDVDPPDPVVTVRRPLSRSETRMIIAALLLLLGLLALLARTF